MYVKKKNKWISSQKSIKQARLVVFLFFLSFSMLQFYVHLSKSAWLSRHSELLQVKQGNHSGPVIFMFSFVRYSLPLWTYTKDDNFVEPCDCLCWNGPTVHGNPAAHRYHGDPAARQTQDTNPKTQTQDRYVSDSRCLSCVYIYMYVFSLSLILYKGSNIPETSGISGIK